MTHPLESFFWPNSIAVLGASPDPHRVRGRLLVNVRGQDFPGRIVPINPSYTEINGLACYPDRRRRPCRYRIDGDPAAQVAGATDDAPPPGYGTWSSSVPVLPKKEAQPASCSSNLLPLHGTPECRISGPNCEGFFNIPGRVAATFSPTAEPHGPEPNPPPFLHGASG